MESNFIKLLSHLAGSLGNKLQVEMKVLWVDRASTKNFIHGKPQLYDYHTITQTASAIIKSVLYS